MADGWQGWLEGTLGGVVKGLLRACCWCALMHTCCVATCIVACTARSQLGLACGRQLRVWGALEVRNLGRAPLVYTGTG